MERILGIARTNFLNDEREEIITARAKELGFTVKKLDQQSYDAGESEIILGAMPPEKLKDAKNLKWLHCSFAGVESYANESLYADKSVVLTNSSGAFGITMSEHLIATTLVLMRHLDGYVLQQQEQKWNTLAPIRSIYGSKITIVGLGDIGTNFAKRVHAMGAIVTAVRKNNRPKPDYIARQFTSDELDTALADADVVVLCLPHTDETNQIMDKRRIGLLQPHAILLNVGRGKAVDQDALCAALNEDRLGGAMLDVTVPEPLPQGHPLWTAKNCFITPHVSGNTTLKLTCELLLDMFLENLKLYAEGKPLNYVVDKTAGY